MCKNSVPISLGTKSKRLQACQAFRLVQTSFSSVPNYCRSVCPKQTIWGEDWELFKKISSILCLWFEIQGSIFNARTYKFDTNVVFNVVFDISSRFWDIHGFVIIQCSFERDPIWIDNMRNHGAVGVFSECRRCSCSSLLLIKRSLMEIRCFVIVINHQFTTDAHSLWHKIITWKTVARGLH